MERPRETLSISADATHDHDALIVEPRNQSASRPAEHETDRQQNRVMQSTTGGLPIRYDHSMGGRTHADQLRLLAHGDLQTTSTPPARAIPWKKSEGTSRSWRSLQVIREKRYVGRHLPSNTNSSAGAIVHKGQKNGKILSGPLERTSANGVQSILDPWGVYPFQK